MCIRDSTFRSYTNSANTWIAMILDPAVVHALILDQYGLMVTDPRLHLQISGNPTVYTRNQNPSVQPRLLIQFAPDTNSAPPEPVGALAAEAGAEDGCVVLRFTAPSDPDDGRAFGYHARYATNDVFDTATVVERWRIPRPREPGAIQRVLLEGLAPGTSCRFSCRLTMPRARRPHRPACGSRSPDPLSFPRWAMADSPRRMQRDGRCATWAE